MKLVEVPELVETDCPLCRSVKSKKVLDAVDNLCGIPGVYSVHQCADCRHLFMNPRPTAATLARCYPPEYAPHLSAVNAVDGASNAEVPIVPWYLRYLPLRHVPGLRKLYYWLTEDLGQPLPANPRSFALSSDSSDKPRAFELGCSTGGYLAALSNAGWDVTGAEPSESASEKARASGFDVITGVLDDVSLPPENFDAAAAWMVIEHVIDPLTTLRQLYDLLKPGAELLISVPNAGCWEPAVFGSCWYVWELPRHLQHFTPQSIRRVLEEVGFINVRVLHQRNVLNVIGSFGVLLQRIPYCRSLGKRLLRYPDSPRLLVQLLLTPFAHALSLLRQGGRLTVVARRPEVSTETQARNLRSKP